MTIGVVGYSYDEIAARLEVSWLTVKRQLVRAPAAVRAARDGASPRSDHGDRLAAARHSPGDRTGEQKVSGMAGRW
jgi:hypothetical protein